MNGGKKFSFSFVYGHNDKKDRKTLWTSLFKIYASHVKGAWVILMQSWA